jgi:hypothetical protein
VSADELDAARVIWHVGDSLHLQASPLVLGGAEIDARIARGPLLGRHRFTGHIAARELQGRSVAVTSGSLRLAAAALEGTAVSFSMAHDAPTEVKLARLGLQAFALEADAVRVELEGAELRGGALRFGAGGRIEGAFATLELKGGRAKLGATELAFAAATAQGVRFGRSTLGWEIGFDALELRGLDVASGATKLRVVRIELAAGAHYASVPTPANANADPTTIRIPELAIDEASFEAAIAPRVSKSAARRTSLPDLALLDQLSGRINVDLNVDAKVPVIQRRIATHAFRIPVDRGTIDFRELERDMSFLEDAVLDFALKKDRLVFQKDIPLVPFDEETIVYWQLDDDEIALAKKNLVRLRRLVDVKVPERPAPEPGSKAFELLKLDLDPVEVVLTLGGPASFEHGPIALRLGAEGRPAVGTLRVTGSVHHRPTEGPQPGELRVDMRELVLALERLDVAGRVIGVDFLEIGALTEASVAFEGLKPTGVRGTLRSVRAGGIRGALA